MSTPGYTNLNSSTGYSQSSTPNGGAAPPRQNGNTGRCAGASPPAAVSMLTVWRPLAVRRSLIRVYEIFPLLLLTVYIIK